MPQVSRLIVILLFVPLLQSCATLPREKSNNINDGLVEIIREEYELIQWNDERSVVYKGVVRNWSDLPATRIHGDFTGFDRYGSPVLTFKEPIARRLEAGQSHHFGFKRDLNGREVALLKNKVFYDR